VRDEAPLEALGTLSSAIVPFFADQVIQAGPAPVIVVCDFEVKHADVVGFIARNLRARYPGAEFHFAVFGAMTKSAELKVGSFSDLTGAEIMHGPGFASIFIAATMSPPGIESPLELRLTGGPPHVNRDGAACPHDQGTRKHRGYRDGRVPACPDRGCADR
jgi:hypothetical protein